MSTWRETTSAEDREILRSTLESFLDQEREQDDNLVLIIGITTRGQVIELTDDTMAHLRDSLQQAYDDILVGAS